MDYVELSVAVRPEAVEAAAELVRQHVPSGISIEPPFEAIDEEGGVALGDEPVRLRAWLIKDGAATSSVAALRRELRAFGDAIIRPLRARTVSDASWADAWKRHFTVLRVGERIVIKPSWRRHRARRSDVVIELDPGQAFGTGQHATTQMCLEELEARVERGATVLDLGCGSGTLAIAAALLGAGQVDALDIDPAAVHATDENAARNSVAMRVARGSLGNAWPFPHSAGAHYDLVLANLSARLVRELARPLIEALRPDGVALVSGIVDEQEESCRDALDAAGGNVVAARASGPWRLLAVSRAA